MQLDPSIIFFSLLFSLSPLLIIALIYFIIRAIRKDSLIEKIFLRFFIGYAVFTLFYIFIPAIINVINPPENRYLFTTIIIDLNTPGSFTVGYWQSTLDSLIRYWGQLFTNSILDYLFFPLTLLPVIFVFGAFLSFLLVLYQLKKTNPKESLASSLALLQFGYEDNPINLMYTKLKYPDWENVWDLIKILIAVLPISLYLLMTLLKVTGNQENPNILQGTSLGWFIEIFFVYLASLMFSVHLLYSGKFSFKGDYMGLKLRNAMIQSLSTVGTLMSAIAIVLFVIDYSRQLFVVFYFISYFIMVTILFGLFLDMFEPISIYLVTKFIEYFKKYSSVTLKGKTEAELKEKAKTTPKQEIFVPKVNLNELASDSPIINTNTVIPNISTEVNVAETEIESQEETITLGKLIIKDFLISLGKIIFTILLILIFALVLEFLLRFLNLSNNKNKINAESAQTIVFLSIFIFLSLPLLIAELLFAKKYVKVTGIAILIQGVFVMIEWTIRYVTVLWSGSDKFSALTYQSSYYLFQYSMFMILLSLSVLLMRKFNWSSISNVSILFITGFIMSLTWLLIFTRIDLVIPVNNITLFKNVIIGFPDFRTPASTFQTLVDSIYQQGESWISYVFLDVSVQSPNISLVVPYLTGVSVNFVPILHYASLFFRFIQPFSTILLFGLIFYLAKLEFLTVEYKDEDRGEKVVYSERMVPLTFQEAIKHLNNYAVSRNFGLEGEDEVKGGFTVTQIEESIYQLGIGAHIIQFIGEAPITFADLLDDSALSLEEILNFFDEISKINLSKAKPFLIFNKEFGFTYEEANLDSLHIMMVDGRSVFTHNFKGESNVEPALVAGLFSAITSFAKETVKSKQLLRTIDHGDVVLMIEYGQYVFSAIFADKNSVELRNKLATFVKEFEEKHEDILPNWLGDTAPFADDWELVNQVFDLN